MIEVAHIVVGCSRCRANASVDSSTARATWDQPSKNNENPGASSTDLVSANTVLYLIQGKVFAITTSAHRISLLLEQRDHGKAQHSQPARQKHTSQRAGRTHRRDVPQQPTVQRVTFQFQKHSEAKYAYQAAKAVATASKWLKRII